VGAVAEADPRLDGGREGVEVRVGGPAALARGGGLVKAALGEQI
jgi:hypothetical protein